MKMEISKERWSKGCFRMKTDKQTNNSNSTASIAAAAINWITSTSEYQRQAFFGCLDNDQAKVKGKHAQTQKERGKRSWIVRDR